MTAITQFLQLSLSDGPAVVLYVSYLLLIRDRKKQIP
jgi:hypothetical protein